MKMNRSQLAQHVGRLISDDRNKTHGDPHWQFECETKLYATLAEFRQGEPIEASARHALQMITTKLSRIVCGKNAQDHWLDIAGYALIAAEHAEDQLDALSPQS